MITHLEPDILESEEPEFKLPTSTGSSKKLEEIKVQLGERHVYSE